MAFIGVDLHTNSFTVCRLEANGMKHLETFHLAASDLERFCLSLDADYELVKQRTRLLNKIHVLHVRHGVKLKKESLSSRWALKGLDIARFSVLEQIELRIVRDQALGLRELPQLHHRRKAKHSG